MAAPPFNCIGRNSIRHLQQNWQVEVNFLISTSKSQKKVAVKSLACGFYQDDH